MAYKKLKLTRTNGYARALHCKSFQHQVVPDKHKEAIRKLNLKENTNELR